MSRELDLICTFESLFDGRRPPSPEHYRDWVDAANLMQALYLENWDAARQFARKIIRESQTPAYRAFGLQFGLAIADTVYDLKERGEWMALWSEIEGWSQDPYARFLRTFHDGLTRFFEASLKDAQERFKQSLEHAVEFRYTRGRMRSLQHLGLVYRDLGQIDAAIVHFEQALALARTSQAVIPTGRILAQLERLSPGRTAPKANESLTPLAQIEWLQTRIERALSAGEFFEARELLAQAETIRRDAGKSRRRCTLGMYLAAVHWALGRPVNGARVWNRIKDPVLRVQALELKERIPGLGLSDGERAELSALRLLHGLTAAVIKTQGDGVEICGIRLSTVRELDVHKLMTALIGAKDPIDKATLCTRLWGYAYDPVAHDGRIYKLIHKARRAFGRDDLIVNTYGAYRLNPRYYDARWLAAIRAS